MHLQAVAGVRRDERAAAAVLLDGLVEAEAVAARTARVELPEARHLAEAIADFAKSVWAAYPDMSLEIISTGDTGGGLVATEWVLHGTHTGSLTDGSPPTGRTVAYPGASFTQVEGDKIRSERTYLDQQTVAELLGLKMK